MSRAAMRKKQKEEETAKKREQQSTLVEPALETDPAPTPIEINSTVSEE
jgi:hypothetical protein